MQRIAKPALAALILGACAAPQVAEPPRVDTVILYRQTVTAQMSDGSICVGQRPQGARVWSGTMTGCAAAPVFAVTSPPRAARQILAPSAKAQVIVNGLGYGPV